MIQWLAWDTRMLGVSAGRLLPTSGVFNVEPDELNAYDLILARVSQRNIDEIGRLESLGFRYIGQDIELERPNTSLSVSSNDSICLSIRHLHHVSPDFDIQGFVIDDSRFMLDPVCNALLDYGFWDRVFVEHCESFADVVVCAIDENNRLSGFISCLNKDDCIEMFLVAVHPKYQGCGVGAILMREVINMAYQDGLPVRTSAMASNIRALNFYLKNNFVIKSGEVVLHRWRREK